MPKKISLCLLLALQLVFTNCLPAQIPPAYNSADIYMQLKKLNVLGSILYIAAHPDDENNSFLPWLAKEKLYRTAYLSLTRGDGGQNLVGSEQGIELGLIRSQELLAARRMDGAEQYFSRAYEFGFSKSATEALRIWDHDKILSDVVWVIRQYQPDVIITRFPGDARAGHGHHAASSILANEAFTAAADPKQFPEQFAHGVQPWQARRILWNTFSFGSINTTSENQLKIDVSGYNPLLGKSYGEIGGEARSMHKSQGEGRPRRRGEAYEYFLTTGGDAPQTSLVDGINIGWSRLPNGAAIENMVNRVIASFNFERPELSVDALVNVYKAIKALPESNWRNKKLQETQEVIEACAGLFADATTTQETVVQGQPLDINLFANVRLPANVKLTAIAVGGFDTTLALPLPANKNFLLTKKIMVAGNKAISQPYWLAKPPLEGSFDVTEQELIGKAENDPAYTAVFTFVINGQTFEANRPVQYKVVDAAKGELYEPLVILPKAEVNFTRANFLSPNGRPVEVGVKFTNNQPQLKEHTLSVTSPIAWRQVTSLQEQTLHDSSHYIAHTTFQPSAKNTNRRAYINALAKVNGGTYSGYRRTIRYDHIPAITYFAPAQANLVELDIKTVGKNIGYIPGAGDKVADELVAMGYNVVFLGDEDLTDENLARFDAVVVGIRAYNIYEYLTDKVDVLNRYVYNGGNLVAQYIKSNQVGLRRIQMGPYPFSVSSQSRVTEEDAAVTFLLPQHPAFNYPNKITPADFEGWVQERSTYQADQADPRYQKLIGMKDSGDSKDGDGSLLVAPYGKGNFVYVSLVLFRQLPAGVPGAYRLMSNLLALPKNNIKTAK